MYLLVVQLLRYFLNNSVDIKDICVYEIFISFLSRIKETKCGGHEMKKAVLYIRQSTKRSRGMQINSIEIQRSILLQWSANYGYKIVNEYVEEASGKLDERPVFKSALSYARDNDCKIIIYRVDRMSRNLGFWNTISGDLSLLRIAQLGDVEPDQLQLGLLLVIAQNESTTLGLRVKAAHKMLRQRHGSAYKVGNPRITTTAHPAAMKVRKSNACDFNYRMVKTINYLENSNDMSYLEISNVLNSMGMTTRRGSNWTASSVYRIMKYVKDNPVKEEAA